jgi:hypothetical protein
MHVPKVDFILLFSAMGDNSVWEKHHFTRFIFARSVNIIGMHFALDRKERRLSRHT